MASKGIDRHGIAPQTGLSLIELMIAIALGTLLLLGLVQIFGGVRASFGSAEALARVQENSRFAMDFLRRDVRMAAHFGCRSEYQVVAVPGRRAFYNHTATNTGGTLANDDTAPYPLWLHRPLEVYDYSANGGTSPGNTYTAALAEFPAGETLATNYTPDLPAFLATTGNGLGTDGLRGNDVGDLVPGSDVVVVRYLNENSVTLSGGLTHADGVLVGASAADFPNRRLFAITDCNAVSLFQITATTPQVVSKADGTNNLNRMVWGAVDAEPQYGVQTAVHGYEFAVYYVGRTGADTPPALFRRRLLQNPTNFAEAAHLGAAEELVPGVEMMQVLLAVDNEVEASPPGTVDDVVNEFRSAATHLPDTLTDAQDRFDRERSVKSLRISLLVRSPEQTPAGAPTATTRLVGDVTVTPPNDRRLRHVYDATIAVRNRVRN